MDQIEYLYSWQEFDADCLKIAQWAKDKNFKNIYGIPRGGLVVAVKLSHLLELPVILDKKDIGSGTLVVDDIVDKGSTLSKLLFNVPWRIRTASLYLGPNPSVKPDLFTNQKVSWVRFPWETSASSRYDGTF